MTRSSRGKHLAKAQVKSKPRYYKEDRNRPTGLYKDARQGYSLEGMEYGAWVGAGTLTTHPGNGLS